MVYVSLLETVWDDLSTDYLLVCLDRRSNGIAFGWLTTVEPKLNHIEISVHYWYRMYQKLTYYLACICIWPLKLINLFSLLQPHSDSCEIKVDNEQKLRSQQNHFKWIKICSYLAFDIYGVKHHLNFCIHIVKIVDDRCSVVRLHEDRCKLCFCLLGLRDFPAGTSARLTHGKATLTLDFDFGEKSEGVKISSLSWMNWVS